MFIIGEEEMLDGFEQGNSAHSRCTLPCFLRDS
jgi:hypothetical protein